MLLTFATETSLQNLISLVDTYLAVSPPHSEAINDNLDSIRLTLEGFLLSDSPSVSIGNIKDCLDLIYQAVDGLELSVDNIDVNTDEIESKLDIIADLLNSSNTSPPLSNQDVVDAIESLNSDFNAVDFATEATQANILSK